MFLSPSPYLPHIWQIIHTYIKTKYTIDSVLANRGKEYELSPSQF